MTKSPREGRESLARASPRFRAIHESIGRAVRDLFPEAVTAFDFGMSGWRIPRRRRVDPESVKGTIDPNWVHIFLAERKAGITLNLWNPVDFNGFRRHRAELERAGFKLMVGCIQFNRKSEFPIGLVVDLLKDIEKSLEEDERVAVTGKGGTPAKKAPAGPKDEALLREVEEWASEPPMDGGD
ncbi:MAG: DUF1801 domain-containing protein [Methanobacteriota archaeon]|nr:MAG: DUF1801 domain-containing protein [Euryarchaeota archaeon]